MHGIKKWKCWDFQAVYSLAPGRSSFLCGPFKGRRHTGEGSRRSSSGFSCCVNTKRLFWGSRCATSITSAPSVLAPWGETHPLSHREGAILSCPWLGGLVRCTTSSLCPHGLQPLSTGTGATRLAGTCCFWARNQQLHPPGH